MQRCRTACLAAAFVVAAGGVALAQAMPTNNPSAAANVRQSERYSSVVRSSPSFRKQRMQRECGPITDPQLHASCIASFGSEPAPRPHTRPAPPSETTR